MGDSVNRITPFENNPVKVPGNVQERVRCKIIEIVTHVKKNTVDRRSLDITGRINQDVLTKTNENRPFFTRDYTGHGIPLNNEFADLAEQLQEKFGLAWDPDVKLSSPLQIEQLRDLISLIDLKSTEMERENVSMCLQRAIKIAKQSEQLPNRTIGKLIYLIDHSPELVMDQSKAQMKSFVEWIDNTFDGRLESKIADLKKYCKRHRKAGIQKPQVAYHNQLPIEISRFLISSTGNVNTGLINVMIQSFILDVEPSLHYEKVMLNNLSLLEMLPELREQVSRISAPVHPRAPANIIIRTTMGLTPDANITDLETRQTAVASLLTAHRQGRDGSCFATPLVIYLLSHHQEMCLNDFNKILSSSKLTKNVNGCQVDFPFLLHIGDQNLNQTVKISSSGSLVLNKGKLLSLNKIPGFRAVKQALGLKKIRIAEYLSLPSDEKEEYTVTIKDIIIAFVKQAQNLAINQEKKTSQLLIHAVFAFEAQECNPLLKMWENTIACMAEADEHSMVRSEIIHCAKNVIGRFLEKRECLPDFIQDFLSSFTDVLNEKMHLQWDPKISNSILAKDQKSTEGAFILYDKGANSNSSEWERVDNPSLYQCFINRAIHEAIDAPHLTNSVDSDSIFNALIAYISSDLFISDSLCTYHSRNCECDDPTQNYEDLRFAPWATKSGNNLEKVIQVYFEQPHLQACCRLNPLNGEQLLEQLLVLLNEFKLLDEKQSNSSAQIIPVRIPYVHAFTLLMNHPTLVKRIRNLNRQDLFSSLHSSLTDVGNQVSSYVLPKKLKHQIINQVKNSLMRSAKKRKFDKYSHQFPTHLTVQELRQSLLHALSDIHSSNSKEQNEIALQVDDLIYRSLPTTLKRKLAMSAIHVADSNWAEGVHAIHLCLVVNPCTGCIELWGSNDDQSELYPLDQSIWFENGDWEIFTNFFH